MNRTLDGDAPAATTFDCPRCSTNVTERFYGPCQPCRDELRETWTADAKVIALADYVPKMNVTPNAVALKDD
jgi:cytidine deaminase